MKPILTLLLVLLTLSLSAQIPTPDLEDGVGLTSKRVPRYERAKRSNTAYFQGSREKKEYFEGWYYKMVAADGESIISIIPGISLSETGDEQHAFIQVIDGTTGETTYLTYPIEDFRYSTHKFAVKIGDNYFSQDKIILNIDESQITLSGEINMSHLTPYSNRKVAKKRIMGWYGRLPFLECYHGVVSLTHALSGQLVVNDDIHRFDGGKGYIEKDWGSSMPSAWVWIQSNNFANSETSFMISIANVPLKKKSFNGFLGFFYYEDKVYRFGTYSRSQLSLDILDQNTVQIKVKNRKETLTIKAKRNQVGLLQAPVSGSMDRRIPESIDAELDITLTDKDGVVIYTDRSSITGFELVGDIEGLVD